MQEFTELYRHAEDNYKRGNFPETINTLAVAVNIIHPNFFKDNLEEFQNNLEDLKKCFLLLAKAHYQYKDYSNCLSFVNDISNIDCDNYEVLKMKYFCLKRLN